MAVGALGVFTDVVNLVFRDDSAENLSEEKEFAKKQQHEFIISKCLRFLKILSRYITTFTYMKEYISLYIVQKE